jgi:methionine-rich copper-binding protein CopC
MLFRRPLVALAALAALMVALASAPVTLSAPTRAFHAYYVSSNPAANATLKASPAAVTVHFAEPVNPDGSAITVYNSRGRVVSGTAQVEQNDLTTMRVPMTGDDSEVYLVVWHTISATDGDPDVGAFSFFISASGSPDLAPKPSATAPATSGTPVWLTVVIGLAGLLIGLAGGVFWTRRTRPAGKV